MAEKKDKLGKMADQELVGYIRSGHSVIQMLTAEEARAELEIARVAKEVDRQVQVWSVSEGFQDVQNPSRPKEPCPDPVAALQKIQKMPPKHLFVLRDMHPYFKNPMVVRLLRDIARDLKQKASNVVILTPVNALPPDLERDVVVLDFDLPTKDQIGEFWDLLYNSQKALFTQYKGEVDEDERDRIIQAAMGLTSNEAENAFSKASVKALTTVKHGGEMPLISKLVMKEKAVAVKKTGILEYFEAPEKKDDIGGLDTLKLWLDKRSRAFSKKAREFGLPMPKGILLTGLPGTGKSLVAKAASNIMGVPLIRFDFSRVFGGIVGQSEIQCRAALQTIDRVGACIVWMDELEKALAGVGGSGNNDSGVTKRVFGNLLTWLSDKTTPAFVVATVNNIDVLANAAPELLRKGRFDEIFFVGLPSEEERKEIVKIHIRKNHREPDKFDAAKLAKISKGFSGAEIEQGVVEGLYSAFYEDKELNTGHVFKALETTNPLSKSQEANLEKMKDWAEKNAVNASINGKDEGHAGRQIQV